MMGVQLGVLSDGPLALGRRGHLAGDRHIVQSGVHVGPPALADDRFHGQVIPEPGDGKGRVSMGWAGPWVPKHTVIDFPPSLPPSLTSACRPHLPRCRRWTGCGDKICIRQSKLHERKDPSPSARDGRCTVSPEAGRMTIQ